MNPNDNYSSSNRLQLQQFDENRNQFLLTDRKFMLWGPHSNIIAKKNTYNGNTSQIKVYLGYNDGVEEATIYISEHLLTYVWFLYRVNRIRMVSNSDLALKLAAQVNKVPNKKRGESLCSLWTLNF